MNNAERDYLNWICDVVKMPSNKYGVLMEYLFERDFTYSIPMDGNRYEDGISLRYRYGIENDIDDRFVSYQIDNKPCSVLEMMVALALRCDEQIMANPTTGGRVSLWFEQMLESLGLYFMTNPRFNRQQADMIMDRFLGRSYAPNGRGGLFTILNPSKDMRSVEIWGQAMLYFNNVQ